MDEVAERLFEKVGGAPDAEALDSILTNALADLGFTSFAYRSVDGPDDASPYVLTNYSKDWADHYFERKYSTVDPVFRVAKVATLPFGWLTEPRIRRAPSEQRVVLDDAAAFGIRGGVTVPIHTGGGGHLATLSVTTDLPPRAFRSHFDAHRRILQLVALYCHVVVRDLAAGMAQPELFRLTGRERECLLWTARGKSAWEIGTILAISERTVVFHLQNAMRRLRVHGKIEAVVKALMGGIIEP